MRVNVYAEELRPVTDEHGDRVTRVKKQVVRGLRSIKQSKSCSEPELFTLIQGTARTTTRQASSSGTTANTTVACLCGYWRGPSKRSISQRQKGPSHRDM